MRTLLAECRPPEVPREEKDIKLRLEFVRADTTGSRELQTPVQSKIADIPAIVDESPELALQAARIYPETAVLSS